MQLQKLCCRFVEHAEIVAALAVLAVWVCQLLQCAGQPGSQKAAALCVEEDVSQNKINQGAKLAGELGACVEARRIGNLGSPNTQGPVT